MTRLLCRITCCGLKNAPASMKIWESGDGRFKRSSAAQCYLVKKNRVQAPITTLTTATCICDFTFLLYLHKLMFMSLNVNFYCQHWKCGLHHSYIRKHLASCCRYCFLFSWGKARSHYYLCFCRATYFLDDLELHKSLPY